MKRLDMFKAHARAQWDEICFEVALIFHVKFIYSEKATKGPAAKNDTTENPGCFNQILSFESRKGSPVATF